MLENLVMLTGTVTQVSVKPKENFIQVSLKLECEDFQPWVEVKGLSQADRMIQTIQDLKGQQVVLRGRLSSYVMKANPPKYPNETKRYQIAVSKGGIDEAINPAPLNYCMFGGTIQEVKTSAAGDVFTQIGVPYHNPKENIYGTYITRVRCPKDTTLEKGTKVVVVGSLMWPDNNGVLVNATQIFQTRKPTTNSPPQDSDEPIVAADVSSEA